MSNYRKALSVLLLTGVILLHGVSCNAQVNPESTCDNTGNLPPTQADDGPPDNPTTSITTSDEK